MILPVSALCSCLPPWHRHLARVVTLVSPFVVVLGENSEHGTHALYLHVSSLYVSGGHGWHPAVRPALRVPGWQPQPIAGSSGPRQAMTLVPLGQLTTPSSDTRQQISGKVSISDIYVKDTANPMRWDHSGGGGSPLAGIGEDCGPPTADDCRTDVASFEVIARIGSGSLNVQQGDISYYITCGVTYSQLTPDPPGPWAAPTEVLGKTVTAVDSGLVSATQMDGTAIADGEEISAGTSFRFEIDLNPTNVDDEGVQCLE